MGPGWICLIPRSILFTAVTYFREAWGRENLPGNLPVKKKEFQVSRVKGSSIMWRQAWTRHSLSWDVASSSLLPLTDTWTWLLTRKLTCDIPSAHEHMLLWERPQNQPPSPATTRLHMWVIALAALSYFVLLCQASKLSSGPSLYDRTYWGISFSPATEQNRCGLKQGLDMRLKGWLF